jgi:EAL domain-containing protein (putative c-di-GMP-specific phosphodiesterase class I)
VLELTETSVAEDPTRAEDQLSVLRGLGVRVAIDDFGTGYSSLAYLERLPVDIIKIDKTFVDRIDDGGRHAALIKGILSLTSDLGLAAVAEGIETAGQLEALEALRCPAGQGYLFSRPIDGEALRAYLGTSLGTSTGAPASALRTIS